MFWNLIIDIKFLEFFFLLKIPFFSYEAFTWLLRLNYLIFSNIVSILLDFFEKKSFIRKKGSTQFLLVLSLKHLWLLWVHCVRLDERVGVNGSVAIRRRTSTAILCLIWHWVGIHLINLLMMLLLLLLGWSLLYTN